MSYLVIDRAVCLFLPHLRPLVLGADPQRKTNSLSFGSRLRYRTAQHQDCGGRGRCCRSLALAGEFAQEGKPLLRRHPDQQPVGPDSGSLFPGVSSDAFTHFTLSPVCGGHMSSTSWWASGQIENKEELRDGGILTPRL